MSEFVRCECCGDLASFDTITFVNNTAFCSLCQDELETMER
ncbi:hypothetical protein [Pseudoneobacillus sp. C159]